MKSASKTTELDKHRAILLACLDYYLERFSGGLVFDGLDTIALSFEQRKLRVEKYYRERRLDRLKSQLSSISKQLQHTADLSFPDYIRLRTGFSFNIFEDLQNRADVIIAQDEIRTEKELHDILELLFLHENSSLMDSRAELLARLLDDYGQKIGAPYHLRIRRGEAGPSPRLQPLIVAPDGKRSLAVQQYTGNGKDYTSVSIFLPSGSGPICAVRGFYPQLKVWWKNNQVIIIEVPIGCELLSPHREVRSYDDVIIIEYIQSSE